MAFNLGAFAGGLAKGGIDTYQTLEAIESQKKRDALTELQTKEAEQAMKGREALRSAIAEQGDMNTATPGAMMAGPAPQGLPQEGGYVAPEVAASEKLARVRQRALEGGADPTAVMQYANAQRADTSAFNTEKAFEWMRGIDKTVTDKGLVRAAEEHLIPEYNKNKGLLNDGLTASVLTDKKGTFVQFKDSTGKVMKTEPLNMQTFNYARDEVGASMLAAAGPEHFYKAREYGLKKEEAGLKREELDIKKPLYAAQTKLYGSHAAAYDRMGAGGLGGKGASGSLYDTAKSMVAAGDAASVESAMLMLKGKQHKDAFEAAWAPIRTDLAKNLAKPEDVALQREQLRREFGFAPAELNQEVMSGQGVGPNGKKRELSLEDVESFNQRYPASAVDPEQLPWVKKEKARNAAIAAIPTK